MKPVPFKYCLTCGYALRGLARPRCPECGRPFDPADIGTYATEHLAWHEEHAPLLGFFIFTAADVAFVLLYSMFVGTWPCLAAALLPLFGWIGGYQVLSRAHERNSREVVEQRRDGSGD